MNKDLQKAWDKTVTQVFLSKKNSGLLSSILTSLSLHWFKNEEDNSSLAYVSGTELHINEDKFLELDKNARLFLVLHEVWHIARLHQIRLENRNPVLWNMACDYVINYDLKIRSGYSMGDLDGDLLINDSYELLSEEEIYKKLLKSHRSIEDLDYDGIGKDIKESSNPEEKRTIQNKLVNTVTKATQQQKLCGCGCGDIEKNLNQFLKPIINWRSLLENFLEEVSDEEEFTWSRPNRRYQDVYLPGKVKEDNKLTHVMFFLDTSGSISEKVTKRFVSEVKYIHETYKPELLTVVQFDYVIRDKKVFTCDDVFNSITIKGYGGTSLVHVRNLIIKERPQAVVIFSDLYVQPMEKLPFPVPIIWICVDNPKITENDVPTGKVVHIGEEN